MFERYSSTTLLYETTHRLTWTPFFSELLYKK